MIGVGYTMQQAKAFFRKQELQSATVKAQTKGLRSIGAMTMRIARRSMRKGRFLRVSEYPEELRALMTSTGGKGKKTTDDIFPLPRKVSSGPPGTSGSAPLRYGGQIKTHTLYFVDPMRMSVVTGPAKLGGVKQQGTPELLEHGGTRTEELRKWKKFYKNGKPLIRLVSNGTGSVTYRGRGFMQSAHNLAVNSLVPQIWEGSIK